MRKRITVALLLLTACGDDTLEDIPRGCPPEMFDSLGYPYPTDSYCYPGVGEDSPTGAPGLGGCSADEVPGVVFTWGRFFATCPACIGEWGGGFTPTDCRALVCETDSDCPLFNTRNKDDEVTTNDYECRNGLCQNADTERYPVDTVSKHDAYLLCLADVERVDDTYEGEPFCVDAAFDEPCPLPLPDACMQP